MPNDLLKNPEKILGFSDLEVDPTLEVDPKPGFWDLHLGWGVYGFPVENLKFRAENPFPEVPQSSCIFWDAQGSFLRHSHFLDFRPARQKPKNDAEHATLNRSPAENSPCDRAQITERPT